MRKNKGFTLIELLVVVAILGVLATMVIASLITAKKRAYTARAAAEMRNLAIGMRHYEIDFDALPGDALPGVAPADMDEYINDGWPQKAPWPDSVYDWDNWEAQGGFKETHQISVRFCRNGINNSCMPNETWAKDFTEESAVYYCLEGDCRADEDDASVKGHCLNC